MAEIISQDLTYFPAVAQDHDQKWPAEPGFFIFNTTLGNALSLAQKFQQHAILWGTTTTPPSVLWTHGRLPDQKTGY